MTDVTQDRGQDGPELSAADEQLLRELTERARSGGLKLTGEGGLLGKLTKMVVEGALEGEMDDHLGYGKHDPAGRDGGNSRNGRPRPFQDHCVSPRMVKGRSMERAAHRVASVISVRPAIRSAPMARFLSAAMALGPERVLTWDLSSW